MHKEEPAKAGSSFYATYPKLKSLDKFSLYSVTIRHPDGYWSYSVVPILNLLK